MGKEYLIAVDLEGIHDVVGEPYKTLNASLDYHIATENAVDEINAVCRALFDNGAQRVVVWDNHGNGKNIDFTKVDERAVKAEPQIFEKRMDFTNLYRFDKIFFLGYHAKEGSLKGVLAHTFSSTDIQYIKINGVAVGEYDIDIWIAGEHGIAPAFAASDDTALSEISDIDRGIVTVVTKYAHGRNRADFIDKSTVLSNIYEGAVRAINAKTKPHRISAPIKAEVRFTRSEYARQVYNKVIDNSLLDARFGEDSHIIEYTLDDICILPSLLWC